MSSSSSSLDLSQFTDPVVNTLTSGAAYLAYAAIAGAGIAIGVAVKIAPKLWRFLWKFIPG